MGDIYVEDQLKTPTWMKNITQKNFFISFMHTMFESFLPLSPRPTKIFKSCS
jgi:hypothetical protein